MTTRKKKPIILAPHIKWEILKQLGYEHRNADGKPTGRFSMLRRVAAAAPGGCSSVSHVLCYCSPLKGGCGFEQAVDSYSLRRGHNPVCQNCAMLAGKPKKATAKERVRKVELTLIKMRSRGKFFTIRDLAKEADVHPGFIYSRKPQWEKAKKLQIEMAERNGMPEFAAQDEYRRQRIREGAVKRGAYERRPDRVRPDKYSKTVTDKMAAPFVPETMTWEEFSDGREFDRTG